MKETGKQCAALDTEVKNEASNIDKINYMYDLWHEFSLGSLSGNSLMVFWYCILFALLVDAAAFVFLILAFKDGTPFPLIKLQITKSLY